MSAGQVDALERGLNYPVQSIGLERSYGNHRTKPEIAGSAGGGTSHRLPADAAIAHALARTPTLRFNIRTMKPPFRTTNKAVEMVYKNANLKTMRRHAGMQ